MMRAVMAGVLMVGMVSMVGACSGEGGAAGSGSGGAGTNSGGGGSDQAKGPYEGTRESVSVASFVLPKGPKWTAEPPTKEEDVEEAFWTTVDEKTGKNICRISLSVQSRFPNDKKSYEILLQASESFKKVEDDKAPPKGGWGVLAHYDGAAAAGSAPFTSLLRTWVTPGTTKMTLGVTVVEGQQEVCDPQKIVDSLEWNGQEAAGASSPA